jgi:hypothetical protein
MTPRRRCASATSGCGPSHFFQVLRGKFGFACVVRGH